MSVRTPIFSGCLIPPTPRPRPNRAHTIPRRSANYKPSIWDYNFIQSLKSDYQGEKHRKQAEKLKQKVVHVFKEEINSLALLELIDTLQRLGLGCLFEKEIKEALTTLSYASNGKSTSVVEEDLHSVALQFRLRRQNGFSASQDVFKRFTNDLIGDFKACLCQDTKGILSLYEASFVSFEGEFLLDKANAFTCMNLKGNIKANLVEQVDHALEHPLYWRIPWMEAMWYIGIYEREKKMDPVVLELAKLNFNMEQSIHQIDIKSMSRWWRNLGLTNDLGFARDRLVECYFWALGMTSDPQVRYCRQGLTKVAKLITIFDDIYDIYGSLDELELFTNAIARWDMKVIEQLPDYMKVSYHALLNTTQEMTDKISAEQGWDISQHLQKEWVGLCKAFLVEARWFKKGYIPTMEEYLKNAWISISGPLLLLYSYCLFGEKITKRELEYIQSYPLLIRLSSIIFRLCNDLVNSKIEQENGEGAGLVQCYMHHTGISEEVAHEYIKDLIRHTWKRLNQEALAHSSFPPHFIHSALNLARTAQCVYQDGNGINVPSGKMKAYVTSLLVEPLVIKKSERI